MAPTKANGRPKLDWNSSRKRKLLRLYFMTDLKVSAIQAALQTQGFHASTRNIQEQLGALLPELSTKWRVYRPSKSQGRDRFTGLKQSRENHISKHQREISRLGHVACSSPRKKPQAPNLLFDKGKFVPSSTDKLYSYLVTSSSLSNTNISQNKSTESAEALRFSDKEVITASVSKSNSTKQPMPQAQSPAASVSETENRDGTTFSPPSSQPSTTKHQTASPPRVDSLRSVGSIGTANSLSTRISSRISSLRYVGSVLSTVSWRSSLVYTPSASSGSPPSFSHTPWTRDEFASWNEFVHDSIIESPSVTPADDEVKSLRTRICCDLISQAADGQMPTCKACGFSEMHRRARSVADEDCPPIDPCHLDRFGNTPLHHAAAAGNTTRVLQLMSAPNRPSENNSQQNTSGETFLHVFRLQGGSQLPDYERILRKASNLEFPFEILDYSGRSLSYRLDELLQHWTVPTSQLNILAGILRIVDGIECENGRLKPMGSSLSWHEYQDMHREGETRLLTILNNWSGEPRPKADLISIIGNSTNRNAQIHTRDQKGHTPLAIAAARGLHEAVSILVDARANPNTRSYNKTSLMEYATIHLARAQKEGNDDLYAQILSCMALLSDRGAKANVTAYDEYSVVNPSLDKPKHNGVRSTITKVLATTRKMARFRRLRSRPTSNSELGPKPALNLVNLASQAQDSISDSSIGSRLEFQPPPSGTNSSCDINSIRELDSCNIVEMNGENYMFPQVHEVAMQSFNERRQHGAPRHISQTRRFKGSLPVVNESAMLVMSSEDLQSCPPGFDILTCEVPAISGHISAMASLSDTSPLVAPGFLSSTRSSSYEYPSEASVTDSCHFKAEKFLACEFPGCGHRFTRLDNLLVHQRARSHAQTSKRKRCVPALSVVTSIAASPKITLCESPTMASPMSVQDIFDTDTMFDTDTRFDIDPMFDPDTMFDTDTMFDIDPMFDPGTMFETSPEERDLNDTDDMLHQSGGISTWEIMDKRKGHGNLADSSSSLASSPTDLSSLGCPTWELSGRITHQWQPFGRIQTQKSYLGLQASSLPHYPEIIGQSGSNAAGDITKQVSLQNIATGVALHGSSTWNTGASTSAANASWNQESTNFSTMPPRTKEKAPPDRNQNLNYSHGTPPLPPEGLKVPSLWSNFAFDSRWIPPQHHDYEEASHSPQAKRRRKEQDFFDISSLGTYSPDLGKVDDHETPSSASIIALPRSGSLFSNFSFEPHINISPNVAGFGLEGSNLGNND